MYIANMPCNATTHSHENTTHADIHLYLYPYLATSWTRPLILYFHPIFLALGIIGNLFTVLSILYRKLHKKSAIFVFFLFLAAADVVKITSSSVLRLIDVYFGVHLFYKHSVFCTLMAYLTLAAQHISAWVLVSAVAFKLYCMKYPFDTLKRNCVVIATKMCASITAVFILANVHVLFRFRLVTISRRPHVYMTHCYVQHHNEIVSIYSLLIYSIIPGFILIVLSTAMIAAFSLNYRTHRRLLSGSESSDIKQKRSETFMAAKNSVIMLIPLSFFHIICSTPSIIYVILYQYKNGTPEAFYSQWLLILINHSLNAFLQLLISRYYRETMLPCLKPTNRII